MNNDKGRIPPAQEAEAPAALPTAARENPEARRPPAPAEAEGFRGERKRETAPARPHPAASGEVLLLDCRAAARLLGVSRNTFLRLNDAGKIPLPLRFSARRVLWRKKELEIWLDAGAPNREVWERLKKEKKLPLDWAVSSRV